MYQGSGLNGADGLGLRLAIPKKLKRAVKKLGRGAKKVVRSPIFKGAVIGAAAGAVYQKVRGARRKKAAVPFVPQVGVVPITRSVPPPVPYIEPMRVPKDAAGFPLPPSSGGSASGGPSMLVRQRIAEKIMAAIPLSPEEMAIVQAGWLGQGMKLAAEAAYGSDAYVPGAGQPLPNVLVEGRQDDNTVLYAGLGLAALLLLSRPAQRRRRRA